MSIIPDRMPATHGSAAGDSLEIETHASSRMLDTLSRHRCLGCGECCRWHGYVFLYRDDIESLARKLSASEEEFLMRRCIVLRWEWDGAPQFRIALARTELTDECTFLSGSACTIHEVKPLLCKAGPAAWPWIRDERSFWFYAKTSPSFHHPSGTLPRSEANSWFVKTRRAEEVASDATSLSSLAMICGVSEAILERMAVVEFTPNKEAQHVRNTESGRSHSTR